MLTIHMCSFSYRSGIPVDDHGHGGGFVFDCRGLPNPGRLPEFNAFTGRDACVIEYFAPERSVHEFLEAVTVVVELTVASYERRNHDHVSVAFGCTGGQHRSVYCAEWLAGRLRAAGRHVVVEHRSAAFAAAHSGA